MRICRMRAVAVDVLDHQPFDRLFIERITACARAHVPRVLGERPFGAIGIDARADVEHARVEAARDSPSLP